MPKKAKQSVAAPTYVLHYWPVQGRAEIIRLTLALCGLEWTEQAVTDEVLVETKKKAGTAASPFGQWPMLVEDGTVLAQCVAILKHLGRQHGLYGSKDKMEDYLVDSFLLGADDLRTKYTEVVFVHKNSEEAKAKFYNTHIDPAHKTERCSGAHLAFLEGFLERSPTEWVAGGKSPSVADVVLFDFFGSLARAFGEEKLSALYPKCAKHQKEFGAIEEIAAYLKSDKRPKQ